MAREDKRPEQRNESSERGTGDEPKRYHRPTLEDYGDARDLTRSNVGTGPDGAFFDGFDAGFDAPGTAS